MGLVYPDGDKNGHIPSVSRLAGPRTALRQSVDAVAGLPLAASDSLIAPPRPSRPQDPHSDRTPYRCCRASAPSKGTITRMRQHRSATRNASSALAQSPLNYAELGITLVGRSRCAAAVAGRYADSS